MAAIWSARPSSSAGYYRGVGSDGPLWQGQGSGYGFASQGVGQLPQGYGEVPSTGWSPTVVYLLIFVAVELIAVKLLERVLR